MAFRDTSERYEYIYGSNVKKLDRETAGSTKSGSPKRAGNTARKSEYAVERSKAASVHSETAIQKNTARFLAFDWKYTLIAVIAVVLCFCGNVLSAWNRTVECNGKADFRFKDREGNITQQAECNKSRD